MNEFKPIVNKVASSGLITLDLEAIIPVVQWSSIDLKNYLYKELILKEKDFRAALKEIDWEKYSKHCVSVFCSSDAIIPAWAYMLITSYLTPFVKKVYFGEQANAELQFFQDELSHGLELERYKDARVIIKGCGKRNISSGAYLAISQMLLPVVKSLMYGEACSSVPVFKRKNK